MLDFSTFSFSSHFISLSLSLYELLPILTHSLSLCVGGQASTPVDRRVLWGFFFFFFFRCDRCLKEKVGMAEVGDGSLKSSVVGFCWSSEIASVWVWCCWVSGLVRLVMGLVEIGVGHDEVMVRSYVVEMGEGSDGFCY